MLRLMLYLIHTHRASMPMMQLTGQSLCQDICGIAACMDIFQFDFAVPDTLANIVKSDVDMLSPVVVLRIVREIFGTSVVEIY